RFSNGFSLLAHYTWSKAMNYDGSYFVHDAKLNYAPTDTDRTHTFVASTLWELPVGKGKRFLSDANRAVELLIGGWQLNQITTWSSGSPFSPSYRDCDNDRDTGPCRPDLVGSVDTSGDRDRWYTTAGVTGLTNGQTAGPWRRPLANNFGTAPRNSLRGPSYFNTDFSMFKNLNFTEHFRGQFRWEVFNLFNNVNLGQPVGCVDCGDSGRITGLAPGATMRQMQFAVRIEF
ncbi:MAG TPA: hypothetical protein VFC61_04410, partial [Blastocatellia bacterium]|nr:hypothetical protein [Blastocatellia bacterium]